jgi:hypothetical protein
MNKNDYAKKLRNTNIGDVLTALAVEHETTLSYLVDAYISVNISLRNDEKGKNTAYYNDKALRIIKDIYGKYK